MCVCVYAFFFLLLFLTLLVKVSGAFLAAQQKNSSANARDAGLTPGSGRFPGEGNGNPVQYSCLENPMNRGGWWAIVHGARKELDTPEGLNHNMVQVPLCV